MLDLFLRFVVAFLVDVDPIFVAEAEQLRLSAPSYLTTETARQHLLAADIAAASFGVERNLILSIAWHESRYRVDAVGREGGNRVSCGVMTPSPKARCGDLTMLGGYLDGAEHLATWIGETGDTTTALLGYAGGFRMIAACKRGPVLRHKTHGDDLCYTPAVFLNRAKRIALKPAS